MQLTPKKWTHYHTERLYHISMLATWVFIIFAVLGGCFLMIINAQADTYSFPPLSVGVSAAVPGIAEGPTITEPGVSGSGGYYATTTPVLGLIAPNSTIPTVSVQPAGSSFVQTLMKLNGHNQTLPAYNTVYPEFSGNTNIAGAIVFLQVRSSTTVTVRASTYADQNGDWYWQSPEPIDPGERTVAVTAQSQSIPQLEAQASLDFYIEPGSKANVPTTPVIAPVANGQGTLFDVLVKIPDQFKVLNPGDQLAAVVKLINFGAAGHPVDVGVQYNITDSNGKIVLQTSETVAVATQISLLKTFNTAPDLPAGTYTLTVDVPSQNLIATSADTFQIKGGGVLNISSNVKVDYTLIIQILFGLLFLAFLIAYFEYNKVSVLSRVIKNISEEDLKMEISPKAGRQY